MRDVPAGAAESIDVLVRGNVNVIAQAGVDGVTMTGKGAVAGAPTWNVTTG